MKNLWKFINTSFGIWLLTSIIGGFAVWQFEQYWSSQKRKQELNDKHKKLALEYEARLSQYSEWAIYIIDSVATDSEKFADCVTIDYLRSSLKVISGTPNFDSQDVKPYDSCNSLPLFQALFQEFRNTSTIGVLAEMRVINEELYPPSWSIDPEDSAPFVSGNTDQYNFRRKILYAINNFLNPDAIISTRVRSIDDYSVSEFRDEIMDSFYGFGPAEFWYGDVFAG